MAKELYVGHLPYEATNEDLRRLFSVAGTVTSVHIITDPVSGKSKGCGYVRMASEDQLKEAINCLDGALMEGLNITVSIARPQKPQPTGRKAGTPRRTAKARPETALRPAKGGRTTADAPKTAPKTDSPRRPPAGGRRPTGKK